MYSKREKKMRLEKETYVMKRGISKKKFAK